MKLFNTLTKQKEEFVPLGAWDGENILLRTDRVSVRPILGISGPTYLWIF